MRPSLILTMIVCLSAGCKHITQGDCNESQCPVPCAEEKTIPCPPPDVASCPIKQKPAAAPAPAASPPPAAAPAPAASPPPAAAPAPTVAVQPQPMMMVAAAPQAVTGSTSQNVRPSRTKFALGFTTINLPIPCLRLIPYNTPTEVTTRTEFTPPPVQQATYIMQPAMSMAPAMAMAPAMTMAPAPMTMAFQPPPTAYVQPPAATYVQPPPVPRAPAPAAAPDCPPVSPQTLERLQQELALTKALLDKMKAKPPAKTAEPPSNDDMMD